MTAKAVLAALATLALWGAAPAASADSVTEIVHGMLEPGVTGSGVVKTQSRSVEGFDVVESKGSIDLDIHIGPKFEVTVEADDNLFDYIRTEIHGDSLVVDSKGSWSTKHNTTVHVTLPHLLALGIQGSGDAHIADYSGDKLGVKIQGSGDVIGTGHTAKLHLVIQGSGNADFRKLDADEVKVRVDGSGDAKVHANQSIEATIHGSGNVAWSGDATEVLKEIYGSGELVKR
jgi:hypothetical protein